MTSAVAPSSSSASSSLGGVIALLRSQSQRGLLTPVEFVAAYVVTHLITRDPSRWLGARRVPPLSASLSPSRHVATPLPLHQQPSLLSSSWQPFSAFPWLDFTPSVRRKLEQSSTTNLVQLFDHWNMKKVPSYVNEAVVSWALGRRKVHLLFTLPTPLEVLQMQAQGYRCVTAFCEPHELTRILQDHCELPLRWVSFFPGWRSHPLPRSPLPSPLPTP